MQKLVAIGVIMLLSMAHLFADPNQTPATKSGSSAKGSATQKGKNVYVLLETSKGNIKIELYRDKAPITVKNFIDYVESGHYNGTTFHRVIPGFVIQGGGFTKDMLQKPTKAPIKNEADNGLKNERGTLSMARTPDVNSATSQFFINLKDNTQLDFRSKRPQDYGYAVFGKVVDGMDVVDEIAKVRTTSKQGHQDVPIEPVTINKASVVKS